MKAKVFEIKRFAVHDGDGIRTTVFFKGCPLECAWCHNPEGINFKPQLGYYADKCLSCGECISVCPAGAHKICEGKHVFERDKCVACGKCSEVCLGRSLIFYGRELDMDELLKILLEDKEFYDNSGGGVTLSGGECLCQADFCVELLKRLKNNGISTAVDTCGFVSREQIDKVMSYTDVFLYDIKAYDEDVHIKCTGQPNKIVLENLRYIDGCGKRTEIRIPFVPGFNSDQIEKIASFICGLEHIIKVRVLPYHNYAGSKYKSLGFENTLPENLPDEEEIKRAEDVFRAYGFTVV